MRYDARQDHAGISQPEEQQASIFAESGAHSDKTKEIAFIMYGSEHFFPLPHFIDEGMVVFMEAKEYPKKCCKAAFDSENEYFDRAHIRYSLIELIFE